MHAIRKKRIILISFFGLGVSLAVGLVLYALKQNINLYYTPSQIYSEKAPLHHELRLGGIVKKNTVHKNKLHVNFIMTDGVSDVPVEYVGVLPNLFREGQGIVAEGQLQNNGLLKASEVLAKHDEKYMPPEVKKQISAATSL